MSNENVAVVPSQAGTVARQEFSAQQLTVQAETASSALASQAQAMVEARFIMAMRRPRDMDNVRQKLLLACERPGFAGSATEKVWGAAWYRKPVGDGVEGFSVRFAEEALRALGNVDVQTIVTWDDPFKRIVTVVVLDLENNIGYPTSIVIEKTVERKKLNRGQTAVRSRINSYGDMVHIVEATDDEVFAKQNNLVSKTIRNAVLRILPGDIQGECRNRILQIRQGDVAKDPEGARKKISDAFASLSVMPSELKRYLGHDLATATPAEIADLRDLYAEIKEGKVTWVEVMAEREDGDAEPDAKPKTGAESMKDKLRAQQPTTPATPTTEAKAPETKREPAEEREPGSDDGPVTAAECKHPEVKIAAGQKYVCPACTLTVEGPWPPVTAKGQRRLDEK